jgi:hypothetical protein
MMSYISRPIVVLARLHLATIVILTCVAGAASALPVFPGAVGFGTQTVAGRGATGQNIYHVTSLDDNYSSPAEGTLRYGIQSLSGPRVIIFDVSGVIKLKKDLEVPSSGSFLTIAGQTAPFPGITLSNGALVINAHDVLVQHIAIRPGNLVKTNDSEWNLISIGNRDCVKIEPGAGVTGYNIVVDHVSCSWSTDELASFWPAGSVRDVTFSNSIFANPIQYAGYQDGSVTYPNHPDAATDGNSAGIHGYGILVGKNTSRISLVRNVMAFAWARNPLIRDSTSGAQIVDNFIYRPGPSHNSPITIGTYRGEDTATTADDLPHHPMTVSAIGNVAIRHRATTWNGISQPGHSKTVLYVEQNSSSDVSLFMSNNWALNEGSGIWYSTDTSSSGAYSNQNTVNPPVLIQSGDPYANSGGTTWSSLGAGQNLQHYVVARAGKFSGSRDAIDSHLIRQIERREGTWLERLQPVASGGVDPWTPVNIGNSHRPFPTLSDPSGDEDGDGYTDLEEVLHEYAAQAEGRGLGDSSYAVTGTHDPYVSPIDAATAVFDSFTDAYPDGWRTTTDGTTGTWTLNAGAYQQTDASANARAVLANTNWTDQVVEVKVTPTSLSTSGFVAVYGRYNTQYDSYYMTLRGSRIIEVKKIKPGVVTPLNSYTLPANFNLNQQHTLRLEIRDTPQGTLVSGTLASPGFTTTTISAVDASTTFDHKIPSGRAAIGTYLAAANYDDVFASPFVSSKAQSKDDFEDGDSVGWTTIESGLTGDWTVQAQSDSTNKVLNQGLDSGNSRAVFSTSATDQSTQARVKIDHFSGNGFVGAYARYTNLNSAYYVTLRNTKVIELKKISSANGVYTFATKTLSSLDLSRWHTLRVEVTGSSQPVLKAYVDGKLELTATDDPSTSGSPVLTSGKGAVGTYLAAAQFDDIVLTAP